jgi:predicted MFS family arabinose efflux permease
VTLPFLAGYFVSYLYRSINAVIGPELAREFSLSAGDLGLLTGMYFFSFGLFQLPLGILLDRYGPRRVNATLLMVAASGGLWFALAESGTGLLLARAVIGLGVSGCLMSALSAFALWHPAERLSTMNGVAFASGMLGAIAVSVPLEIVLRSVGWREVFFGIVLLTVLVSLVLALAVPEHARVRKAVPLAEQLREYSALAHDPAFWRIALCAGTTQLAAVALVTLWVATWLRDVAGYSAAQVAQALLAFNVAMIAGYIGFGRAADRLVQGGRSTLPLLMAGLATASACLGLLLAGVRSGHLLLWCGFFCCSTAAVLSYSLFSRRYPKEMAGRVNSAVNVSVFIGVFSGQWLVGLILSFWPPTAIGYAPEAYRWAFGLPWLLQFAGLAWLWHGRHLFQR